MIKNNKKFILGILVGIIMMSGVGVVAAIFNAEDISFTPNDSSWEVTNVKEAMDSLYDKTGLIPNATAVFNAPSNLSYNTAYPRETISLSLEEGRYLVLAEGATYTGSSNTTASTSKISLNYGTFTKLVEFEQNPKWFLGGSGTNTNRLYKLAIVEGSGTLTANVTASNSSEISGSTTITAWKIG